MRVCANLSCMYIYMSASRSSYFGVNLHNIKRCTQVQCKPSFQNITQQPWCTFGRTFMSVLAIKLHTHIHHKISLQKNNPTPLVCVQICHAYIYACLRQDLAVFVSLLHNIKLYTHVHHKISLQKTIQQSWRNFCAPIFSPPPPNLAHGAHPHEPTFMCHVYE